MELRIKFEEVVETLAQVLIYKGLVRDRAFRCATLFAEASCDGVHSHGVKRFPRLLRMIENGSVDVNAEPKLIHAFRGTERWDGQRGIGNIHAQSSMERAIELARSHGIGCVALANTNHWMRGGSYGWQAAIAGMIGICWTNTLPNLPAWGASEPTLGNNPLVVAVPRSDGHVVLDMAMSQFSFGALEEFRKRGEDLPVVGGFDEGGNLTCDPEAIEKTGRVLPIGFWKGTGLSIVLDMIAAMLSGGLATHHIPTDPDLETGISQVFIAIDPRTFGDEAVSDNIANAIIASIDPNGKGSPRYPGSGTMQIRKTNLADGIPVDNEVWEQIREESGVVHLR